MKRCGYCKGCGGYLYRVILTSNGNRRESYAHKDCIPKWRNVSDIVETSEPPVNNLLWKDAPAEYKSERYREIYLRRTQVAH